ncbi:MAG: hypothetical protein JWM32_3039 [Verrucomicrobia bacterium]|nr:hypothetical protein [Verrucomicrobiota bacterium]
MKILDRYNHLLANQSHSRGHDLVTHPREANDEWVVALAFSGGGTRAAALSYGVLEELSRTVFHRNGEAHRLLNRVRSISAVSGGSFTAAYYAVHGERIFTDFERVFLKRDVQGAIMRRMADPRIWLPLASKKIGRSDVAADFYHREIFDGATFGDLLSRSDRPDLLINATDMVTGNPFAFTQRNFDLINSDLTRLPLARAVAASSAAPLVLSPITLQNHAAKDTASRPAFAQKLAGDLDAAKVPEPLATAIRSYLNADDRPFVHLVDGGVSDNLGLRGLLDVSAMTGGFDELLTQCNFRGVRKIAVIVVNAATQHGPRWSHGSHPGVLDVLQAVSQQITHRGSSRAIADFRSELESWRDGASSPVGPSARAFHLIEVGFEHLADPTEQAFFHGLPTSLNLPGETVDRLREAGGRLLRQSDSFRDFRADFEMDREQEFVNLTGGDTANFAANLAGAAPAIV